MSTKKEIEDLKVIKKLNDEIHQLTGTIIVLKADRRQLTEDLNWYKGAAAFMQGCADHSNMTETQ